VEDRFRFGTLAGVGRFSVAERRLDQADDVRRFARHLVLGRAFTMGAAAVAFAAHRVAGLGHQPLVDRAGMLPTCGWSGIIRASASRLHVDRKVDGAAMIWTPPSARGPSDPRRPSYSLSRALLLGAPAARRATTAAGS